MDGKARIIGEQEFGRERSLGMLRVSEHFGEQSLLKEDTAETTFAASTRQSGSSTRTAERALTPSARSGSLI